MNRGANYLLYVNTFLNLEQISTTVPYIVSRGLDRTSPLPAKLARDQAVLVYPFLVSHQEGLAFFFLVFFLKKDHSFPAGSSATIANTFLYYVCP